MNTQVQQYIDAVPEDRKPLVVRLHALIMEEYPDAEVDMSYKMPTYTIKSGWVAWANQKYYVSLYTCGPQHIAAFKEAYPGIKTGKACINLKTSDPLPESALKGVVRHAMQNS